jgi:predicted transcriptional regulator
MLPIYILLSKWTTFSKETTMDKEKEILGYIKNNLIELLPLKGLNVEIMEEQKKIGNYRPDFEVEICFEGKKHKLIGEIWNSISFGSFNDKIEKMRFVVNSYPESNLLLVAKYLSEEKRNQCKDAKINFVDLSGNVFIAINGIYIERIGEKNKFPEKRLGRNPFSDKASLILRALMADVDKLWGIRELAESVNLDPGFVSRMVKELKKINYVRKESSKVALINPKKILEDWVDNYDYSKNEEIKFYCLAKNVNEIYNKLQQDFQNINLIQYALGYQAGANLVYDYSAFNVVHIYLQNKEMVSKFEKLNLKRVDRGENLVFLIPYYKNSVFYGRQNINNLWVVSDLQLYLDMYHYPLRGREQAEKIYDYKLKKILRDENDGR